MGVVIGETAEIGDDCTIYQGVTLGGTSLDARSAIRRWRPASSSGPAPRCSDRSPSAPARRSARTRSSSRRCRRTPPRSGFPPGSSESTVAERREQAAARIGFSAYAISDDIDDPMVQAVHRLLDHAIASEERINKLIARLAEKGVRCSDLHDARSAARPQAGQPAARLAAPRFNSHELATPRGSREPSRDSCARTLAARRAGAFLGHQLADHEDRPQRMGRLALPRVWPVRRHRSACSRWPIRSATRSRCRRDSGGG